MKKSRNVSKFEDVIRGLELEKGRLLTEEERMEFEKSFEDGMKLMEARRNQRENIKS